MKSIKQRNRMFSELKDACSICTDYRCETPYHEKRSSSCQNFSCQRPALIFFKHYYSNKYYLNVLKEQLNMIGADLIIGEIEVVQP